MARLFPVVHPDHPEREAEYQRLMRDELVTSRLAGIDAVEAVLGRSGRKVTLDEAEMLAFVQAVNSVRLVLGTVLDVGEDDDVDPSDELARHPRVPAVRLPVVGPRLGRPGDVRRPAPAPDHGLWKRGTLLLVSRCSQLDEASAPIV